MSCTRNFGLSIAQGEYVIFIDADDYINKDCIQELYDLSTRYKLDILRWKYQMYFEKSHKRYNCSSNIDIKYLNRVLKAEDFFNIMIEYGSYEVFAWMGMYKRKFLLSNHLLFPEKINMEDHLFTLQCLTINFLLYQYVNNVKTY